MKTREDILSPAVPEGWWLAPDEPSEEMWAAYFNAVDVVFARQRDGAKAEGRGWKGMPAVVWDAMRAAAPTPPAAEAPGQEPVVETLRSVIARLESACELLASTRPQAAYIAMIDGGQADALLALDEARQEARTVLSAPPTYADAEAKGLVVVAPLEWDEHGRADVYSVSESHGMGPKAWMAVSGARIIHWAADVDEAKSAAQANHERRTRSSLGSADPVTSEAESHDDLSAAITHLEKHAQSLREGSKRKTKAARRGDLERAKWCDVHAAAIRSLASPAPKGET